MRVHIVRVGSVGIRSVVCEPLESRRLMAATGPVISEFLASNVNG